MNKIQDKLDTKEPQRSEEHDSQKRVEEKVDKLMITVATQRKLEGHLVKDCVDDVVRIKLQEDDEEAEELRKRKTSVIIHGLEESQALDSEDRKAFDEDVLLNLLHEIKCDKISIQSVIRLGRKETNDGAKPRPLK